MSAAQRLLRSQTPVTLGRRALGTAEHLLHDDVFASQRDKTASPTSEVAIGRTTGRSAAGHTADVLSLFAYRDRVGIVAFLLALLTVDLQI